jgi:hypothetical protein
MADKQPKTPPPVPPTEHKPNRFVERLGIVINAMVSRSTCSADRQKFLDLLDYLSPPSRRSRPLLSRTHEIARLAAKPSMVYSRLVEAIRLWIDGGQVPDIEQAISQIEWMLDARDYFVTGDAGLGFRMERHSPATPSESAAE